MTKSAIISHCGKYRYRLDRTVSDSGPVYAFFGVNPSTADASVDDATVRKWRGFVQRWGGSRFIVGNVFAYRSTDVRQLAAVEDAFGDLVGEYITNIITPDLSGYSAQVIEENGRFALTYWPYCTKCKSPFQFDAEEPFAYCSCGTTEWGDPRPASWVHPLAEAQEQPVHHLMNPWQRAIDEALIVNCLDCTHASESPERALARLIRAEVDMALNLPVDNSSTERPDMSQTTETTLRAQLAEAQRGANCINEAKAKGDTHGPL